MATQPIGQVATATQPGRDGRPAAPGWSRAPILVPGAAPELSQPMEMPVAQLFDVAALELMAPTTPNADHPTTSNQATDEVFTSLRGANLSSPDRIVALSVQSENVDDDDSDSGEPYVLEIPRL